MNIFMEIKSRVLIQATFCQQIKIMDTCKKIFQCAKRKF